MLKVLTYCSFAWSYVASCVNVTTMARDIVAPTPRQPSDPLFLQDAIDGIKHVF